MCDASGTGPTENYTYDAIYQLTQVVQNGSTTSESYTYDPVGNRLSSLAASPWNYNVSNQLTSISGSPGTTFTYDSNGNTTSKTDSAGTTTYTWDYENRLTSVTLPASGGTVSFTYDPLGRRIKKATSNTTTTFVYDEESVIEEVAGNGAVVARYVQGLNTDEPLAMLRSGATSFYNADSLGSITSLSSAGGILTQTYVYDAFGNSAASSGSLTNPFQYTGREFDSETNLYYYRARYYDPSSGRFVSEDPVRFSASIDFYDYTDNNPVNWSDPAGLTKAQVCCRGLHRWKPFGKIVRHCYIQFLDDNGKITDTYGVLGNPNSTKNQIPRHGNGVTEDDGTADRNSGAKPKDCKDLTATDCQLESLRNSLQSAVNSGTCPSCGDNYRAWVRTDLFHFFDGFNSNTFIYNMVERAGIQPPRQRRAPGYHHDERYW